MYKSLKANYLHRPKSELKLILLFNIFPIIKIQTMANLLQFKKVPLFLFGVLVLCTQVKAQTKPVWDSKDVAILLIDYQPEMFGYIQSSDPKKIEFNIRAVAHLAKAFDVPVVLSTVSVYNNINKPTIDSLKADLPGIKEIDRSSMDAWEDKPFVDAVKATGRKKLVICGLFTEICLAYAVIEAKSAGYEVMFIEDAVGGISKNNHDIAVQRMIQAGAIPNTVNGFSAELFRDWKRPDSKNFYVYTKWYMSTEKIYFGLTKK